MPLETVKASHFGHCPSDRKRANQKDQQMDEIGLWQKRQQSAQSPKQMTRCRKRMEREIEYCTPRNAFLRNEALTEFRCESWRLTPK
jgi:hypothetical protein